MIRDRIMQMLFIPFLGIGISYTSGIITYSRYNSLQVTGASLYFIWVSFCIWKGCQWIHLKLRKLYPVNQKPFSKILSISLISGLYGSALMAVLCMIWLKISGEPFSWNPIYESVFLSTMAVIIFTLVYEVLYLSKEREIDNKIVNQLDEELTHAEMNALRNELDPHFIFNSLNTLSHLIAHDPEKAGQFNRKLAEVYKYFLLNRSKDLVTVSNEVDFIKNYFFLLQIRHDNNIQWKINLNEAEIRKMLIIPCALQILVENAIKHNELSKEKPLMITISSEKDYLVVQNSLMQKPSMVNSTKVGLRNLDAQYFLMARKNIRNDFFENRFVVKLPIITK
ncbi:MAG TPA: histidine kinase [Ferruginibacter sp.]|nr:histidine kinase [Ferruginibacter sp.]